MMLRNVSLEICLYCGLDAPNTDLMYVLVSRAISTIPVRGLYMISLRARRALLSGVAAETAAVFLVLRSLYRAVRAVTLSSGSLGA